MCRSPAKHPATPDGHKSASRDPAQVARWYDAMPQAGVGFATGQSGVLVLDVDPANGGEKSFDHLVGLYGIDVFRTMRARTGGGGVHLYYVANPHRNITTSAGLLGPGLDTRGVGGFVVAPPSPHASGHAYAWDERGPREMIPFPEALWAHMESQRRHNGARNGRAPPIPDVIQASTRNVTLSSLAGTMRHRNASYDAIYAALMVENETRCRPPLDESEIRTIAQSYARYPPGWRGRIRTR
jgi:putative DNA primase/helicase